MPIVVTIPSAAAANSNTSMIRSDHGRRRVSWICPAAIPS